MRSDIHPKDLRVAYVGGGSRDWAWNFFMDLALDARMEGTISLYDIDRLAAEQNAQLGQMISAREEARAAWRYEVADTLDSALKGADFVIISILPGTFEEMNSDVHLPERYGIYQSVGDTVGPAGLIRSLRAVPMYAHIAKAIARCAPDAWVISYTNPMSVCVRALYQVFPAIKAIGCCHEVFHTQDLLADMLRENGVDGVDRRDIFTGVLGLNHFTWVNFAQCQGMDLMPMFDAFARKHAQSGYASPTADAGKDIYFRSAHRVLFDLYLKYQLIPAGNDRHMAEFLPPWYLQSPEVVEQWKFHLTPVSWRMQDLERRLARSEALRAGREPLALRPSGEEGHLMMEALLGLRTMVTNVNMPNAGQIENIARGAIVETNALIARDRVMPIQAGALPGNVLGLIAPHVINQENIVRAALSCDRALAFSTFLNDPLVRLSPADARALFDQMIENTSAHLPEEWGS